MDEFVSRVVSFPGMEQVLPIVLPVIAMLVGLAVLAHWRKRTLAEPMEFQFNSLIFRRLLLSVTVSVLLVVVTMSLWSLEMIKQRYKNEVRAQLIHARDTTNRNLELWVENRQLHLAGIASDPELLDTVRSLIESHQDGGINPSMPELVEIRKMFSRLTDRTEVKGFFVIEPGGSSVASMRNSNLNRRNLIWERRPDLFARVLEGDSVLVPPIPSDVRDLGSDPIRGFTVPPTMFVAVPIRDEVGRVIAVLTERLDPSEDFSALLQAGSMEETGESYAFNHAGALLSELRNTEDLRKRKRLYAGENPILSIKLRDPGPGGRYLKDYRVDSDLRSLPLTRMAQSAISRENGYDMDGYHDFRGEEVFGAWLWNDALSLGLATEVRIDEAMSNYGFIRFWVFVLVFTAMFVFLVMLTAIMRVGARANRALRSSREMLEERVQERTKALRDSENRLEKVVDHVPAPVYLKDEKGRYLLVNKTFEKVTGFDRASALGKDDYAIQPKEIADAINAMDNRVRSEFKAIQEEERIPHPDGSVHDYWSNKTPVPLSESGDIGVLGVSMDITERKHIERAMKAQEDELSEALGLLEAIMDSATYAIIATDTEGTIKVFNKAAEELLQYHEAELLGKHSPALFHDAREVEVRAQLLSNELNQNIEPGFDVFIAKARIGFRDENEWTYIRKDGVRIPVMLSVNALRDRFGDINGYLGIAMDITERRRMEQELLESRDQAEVANLAKSEFLASMSHEIRTPMNGVLGMLDLVLQGQLEESQRRKLMIAQGSARSLLSIINDILDFSKVESGKLELESIQFDLPRVLDETVKAMAYKAEQKGLELILDQTGVTSYSVDGDPGRLRQILNNLLSNAIKFTEKGEVVVRARTRFYDENHYQLMCTVTDTGVGIPAEKLEYLFESFSQVDASTTRLYGGTGLGLAICKKMCELMDGDIKVTSEEGRGSSFKFSVLLGREDRVPDRLPTLDLNAFRVLIVDDNATNREILSEQVAQWGLQAFEADGADQGLGLCREAAASGQAIDLVILDMHMPHMDGLSFAREIRENPEYDQMKLLMLTSVSHDESTDALLARGLDGFLNKPVGMNELRDALSILLSEESGVTMSGRLLTAGFLESLRLYGAGTMSQEAPESFYKSDWPANTRILLVEDNQINQMVAQELLQSFYLRCDLAGNGLEALAALRQAPEDAPYTLILMDCQMPEMDGYTATQEIRSGKTGERYLEIPILAMTAHAMQGDRERCLAAGMDDYLSKPIDAEKLKAALWHFLGGKRSLSEGRDERAIVEGESGSSAISNGGVEVSLAWDYTGALSRMGGSLATMTAVVELFLSDVPERLAAIEQALEEKDYLAVEQQAHTIKGTAGNVGAAQMQREAAELEEAVRQSDHDNAQRMLQALHALWCVLEPELKGWQHEHGVVVENTAPPDMTSYTVHEGILGLEQRLLASEFVDPEDMSLLCAGLETRDMKDEAQQLRKHLLSFNHEAALQVLAEILARLDAGENGADKDPDVS